MTVPYEIDGEDTSAGVGYDLEYRRSIDGSVHVVVGSLQVSTD
ncbi:hypothetical protein [Microbacterium sp. NPDC055683]